MIHMAIRSITRCVINNLLSGYREYTTGPVDFLCFRSQKKNNLEFQSKPYRRKDTSLAQIITADISSSSIQFHC